MKPGRWLTGIIVCVAAASGSRLVRAQSTLSTGGANLLNYAYATQLGSGIYSIDGRTLQIYRIPLSTTLGYFHEGKAAFDFTFPFTIGIFDFEPTDVLEKGLPDRLDSYSLVPGVGFVLPANKSWTLTPFAEAGLAHVSSYGPDTQVYSFGCRSRVELSQGEFGMTVANSLIYTGFHVPKIEHTDDFGWFQTGFEVRHPMGFDISGKPTFFAPYFMQDLYSDNPRFPVLDERSSGYSVQWELGVTLGTDPPLEVLSIKLPRIGLGYRFGTDLSSIRIVLGMPF